jgi:hypothetical protein
MLGECLDSSLWELGMDIRPLSPHTVLTTRGNSKNQTALVKHNGKDEIQLDLSG